MIDAVGSKVGSKGVVAESGPVAVGAPGERAVNIKTRK
jgi:hypothetical protein